MCEDNTTIVSGKDVPIAWFIGGYIVQCSEEYRKLGQCGTYIEIHRPNNPKIEEESPILLMFQNGFNTQYISTKNLCTGRYEFWLVVRTRNGSILQFVKPFFSKYPSCRDYNIDKRYEGNYKYYQLVGSVNTIKDNTGKLREKYVLPPLPKFDADGSYIDNNLTL